MTDVRQRSRRCLERIVCSLTFLAALQGMVGHGAAQESLKIADVGEWAWNQRDGEIVNPIYKYEGLMVSGELLVRDYRDALMAVKSFIGTNEYLVSMRTHTNPKDTHFGFLTVDTSFKSDRYRHRTIYLQNVNGHFNVVGEGGWIE